MPISSSDTVHLHSQTTSNMSKIKENSDSNASNKPERQASPEMTKRESENSDSGRSDICEVETSLEINNRTSENSVSGTFENPQIETSIKEVSVRKSTVQRILRHSRTKKQTQGEGRRGTLDGQHTRRVSQGYTQEHTRRVSQVELSKHKSWFNETNLLINCIAFSVGVGNIWRFPYMAHKYGGGAFLIPYLILRVVIGLPLYYMELFLGQYSGLGPVRVWSFCPFFKGLGITVLLCVFVVHSLFNIIMAYVLLYLVFTFRDILPWSKCNESWGSKKNCFEISGNFSACQVFNYSNTLLNNCLLGLESSTDQFWKNYVLGLSSGLDDPRAIKWDVAIALLVSGIIVCALVIRRYHTEYQMKFKTVYVTAFFPYVVLTAFFIYVAFFRGAGEGLAKLFIPDYKNLLDIKVWYEAAEASFFSVGIGMGGIILFGTKNELHYNIKRCAMIVTFVDAMTSLFAACVVCMITGFLSETLKVRFAEATLSGPGLLFITFPHAAEFMGLPQFWLFLFFLMIFCLTVDTSVGMTEALSSGLKLLCHPSHPNTKLFVIITCSILYVTGLPCATYGGAFLVKLLDRYGAGHCLMGTIMLESIAFGWGYGLRRIKKNFEIIHGYSPSYFLQISLVILAPIVASASFVYSAIYCNLTPLYDIPYPPYANAIGWGIVTVVLAPVPVCMFVVLIQHRQNWRKAFQPANLWIKHVRRRKNNAVL